MCCIQSMSEIYWLIKICVMVGTTTGVLVTYYSFQYDIHHLYVKDLTETVI